MVDQPRTITIPARFCGPAASGHGGYTCGLVAGAMSDTAAGGGSGQAAVSLRLPPPLDRPLTVRGEGAGVSVTEGDSVVATAEPTTVEVEAPPPVAPADAADAESRFWLIGRHPFPTCYACGPERPHGDGLRIFAGKVEGRDLVASRVDLPADVIAPDGSVPSPQVWAILDCPTAAAVSLLDGVDPPLPWVLARLAVRIDAPADPNTSMVAAAWPVALDGRKFRSAGALYADGRPVAVSEALWVQLRRPA